jgi:hypothetical protein
LTADICINYHLLGRKIDLLNLWKEIRRGRGIERAQVSVVIYFVFTHGKVNVHLLKPLIRNK